MTHEECELKANEVRKEFNPKDLAPFPYENISDVKNDVEILFGDFDEESLISISGVIFYKEPENSFKIMINSVKSKTRQNFTIAHELGHYFLHQDVLKSAKVIVDDDNYVENKRVLYSTEDIKNRDQIEFEANFFAAALLMPKNLVSDAWNRIADIKECADIFGVSQLAMTIRLTRLGFLNDD
jgi:Zn-dependent peptidase ImmA (M78 family)